MVDIRNAKIDRYAGMLPAVLAATVPAGHTITTLNLRACVLSPATFQGCAKQLAAVDQVVVLMCLAHSPQLTLQPALDALLRQTPVVDELVIWCQPRSPRYGCLVDGLPAAAAGLCRLTSLILMNTRLPRLSNVLDGLPGETPAL